MGLSFNLFLFLLFCVSNGFSPSSLIVTGDVNLNPLLPKNVLQNYSFVWNDMIDVLRSADVLAINHESTLAGILLSNPNVIQFEDPIGYLDTYGPQGVNVTFMNQANNHQNDFGDVGLKNTVTTLDSLGIAWGGLSKTFEEAVRPTEIVSDQGVKMAFFTMVIDECWMNNNGTLYLDGCTCGTNAGPPPPYQCYNAGSSLVPYGLWYHFGITDGLISNVTSVVGAYKKAHPDTFVVTYLHCGPNFQWQPYENHVKLLQSLAGVSNLIWGTSSHHIQRFEVFNGTPIIYGLGDLLFRHTPGVSDFCPLYAIPCEQYRPDIALTYQFDVVQGQDGLPKVDLDSMFAYPTRHDEFQVFRIASGSRDLQWIEAIYNELSPNTAVTFDESRNAFKIQVKQ